MRSSVSSILLILAATGCISSEQMAAQKELEEAVAKEREADNRVSEAIALFRDMGTSTDDASIVSRVLASSNRHRAAELLLQQQEWKDAREKDESSVRWDSIPRKIAAIRADTAEKIRFVTEKQVEAYIEGLAALDEMERD